MRSLDLTGLRYASTTHRGVYGITRHVTGTTPWLIVSFVANLVSSRSYGSCYVDAPGVHIEVIRREPPGGVDPLVVHIPLKYWTPGLSAGVRRYQVMNDLSDPFSPFGLQVDPLGGTVQPPPTISTDWITWNCAPPFYPLGCVVGGDVALIVPGSSSTLSNYNFLIGTLLGVLVGLVAASALQFQRPKRRSVKATEHPAESDVTASEAAET
jgi:hypothetical protein